MNKTEKRETKYIDNYLLVRSYFQKYENHLEKLLLSFINLLLFNY